MASQDLTPEALEGYAAQLDGRPAHQACPHFTSSPACMAWLVGACCRRPGARRRAMSACRAVHGSRR